MNAQTPRPKSLDARSTAAALSMLMAAAGTAQAQIVDTKVPLNYNYHGLAHAGETVATNNNFNADVIQFRSIADRGIYWDPSDFHAFGTNPIIGATGITYALFDSLGYTNTTAANAAANGLDCVHLGNRVWNRGFEFFTNSVSPGTSTGPAPSWAPVLDVSSLTGDGTTATATTAGPHGLSVGQVVAIVGASPVAFNGNATITAVPTATTFQYASTANATATGAIFSNSTSTAQISALSIAGTTVTATTIWPHGFGAGNTIHVTGASDPNFDLEANTLAASGNTFTYTNNNGPVGSPTGTRIVAATCVHDTADQQTVLSGPVVLDANAEIGVLYTISNGDGTTGRGGSFDVVLTFTDATTVTTRLHGNNWDSTALPNIVSNLVTSQQLIKHTFGGTTSSNFRSVSNTNDAATLNNFNTSNIGVMEGIISVPAMTAGGINVVGKTLSKVAFKNSFYNPTQITALSFDGATATATIATTNSPFVPGQPISISGVSPASLNGDYNILSVNTAGTQFTFASGAPAGTGSAKMYANGLGITTLSLVSATGTVVLDSPGATLAVGDRVTISGVNALTGTSYANGVFTVASVTDATHFTYKNGGASGTASARMYVTRPGDGRGYQVHAVTVRNGLPTNTTCAAATALTGPVASASGTNAHVVEASPPTHTCGSTDNSAVYYSYTAIGNNPVTITTCSSFNPSISVYTGTCGGTLTQVTGACTTTTSSGCAGSASPNVGASLGFGAIGGTTYYIRIAGQNNAWGSFTIGVSETVNGSCSGAPPITAGDTTGQTFANAGGGTTPCGGGNDTNAIWYQYTVGGTGTHLVEARTCLDGQNTTLTPQPLVTGVTGVRNTSCSTATPIYPLDTTLAVYTMDQCGQPTPMPIECNDNGCSVSSRLQWMGTAGTTYLVRVASKSSGFPSGGAGTAGATGTFVLHIDDSVHTDLAVPLTFNWNGICHGTRSVADANFFSEQCVTAPASHENRTDLNGYRSISDRGLLFDPNNSTPNAFNYGGTIGYRGMEYSVYGTPLQMDLVHVAQAASPYRGGGANGNFKPNTQTWASPTTAAPAEGRLPLWLQGDPVTGFATYDHYSNVLSNVSAMNAVFGDDTRLGLIYHMTNLGANVGSFNVTLTFADSFQAQVTCNGTDWFGGASATPCNASLPASPQPGVEAHRVLGVYNAVQNIDRGDPASTGQLKVVESVISTASLAAAGQDPRGHGILTSIKFDNVTSSDVGTNVSVFAATLRDPLSYNFTNGPSAIGTVSPNQLNAGGTGTMTVSVTLGSAPSNTIASVEVDATAIGLGSNFALNVVPGTNTTQWSRLVSFPVDTVPNAFSLPFTATDVQNRQATGNIIFSVVAPTGSIVPNPAAQGGTAKVTFNFGTAGGIASIDVDGSPIGLGTISLNDSGTGGDATAADGIWSADFVVPVTTIAPANYMLPFTLTDTGSNQAFGSLSFDVILPPPANDACADAIALTSGVPFNGDNSQATSTDGAASTCQGSVSKGVWFSFTTGPADAGTWIASTCGSTQDTVLTVYNPGSTCSTLDTNQMACNDDNGPGCAGLQASVQLTLAASSTYLIRVQSFQAAAVGGAYTLVVQPLITGACCNNTTGACTQTVSTSCSSTTSSYQGDNVACPTTCAVVAVCCNNSTGACTSIYGGLCPGNTTQGNGTVCVANVTCPPSGACCNNATGACTFVYGGSACPANTSFGQNTTCDAATCPVAGACCNNTTGACSFIYGGSCPANTSGGVNSVCDASTCPPVGVCCHNVTSQCIVLYGGLCPANASFDPSTSCNPAPCTPIAWACCFADGSCLTLFQNDCGTHSGATWAPGQTCGVYICPSCTNVLANPGAEAGDLSGWTIDVNGGNGWQAGANVGDAHSGSFYFATSYSLSRRHQTIDLTQFFTPAQLDAAPDIAAGEWVHTRGDQGGQYYILVQLLAADGTTVIASFNDGTQTALTQLPAGTPYQLVSTTFTGYGPGVRFLRFEDGGRDVAGWAGFYGTHFDDAFAGPTQTTAACCASSGCSVISNADCVTAGGTPQACGTTCSPSPCPSSGVCCRGATCSTAFADAAACQAAVNTTAPLTVVSKFVPSASVCNTPVTVPGSLGNTVSPCCYADFNHNNSLEVQDIFDFLNDWFAGKKAAIVGGDGTTGTLAVQNIFDFLNAWFAGGCSY